MKGKFVINILLVLSALMIVVSVWSNVVAQDTSSGEGQEATSPPAEEGAPGEEELVVTRTPAPTLAPGVLTEQVSEITRSVGLDRTTILGLRAEDWINLLLSVVLVLATYVLAGWLLQSILRRLVRRTESELDDALLAAVGPNLKWLLVLMAMYFGTVRLVFVSAELKELLGDIYFTLAMVLAAYIVIKSIDFAMAWYRQEKLAEEDRERLRPFLTLVRRLAIIGVILVAATILLSHYGINVTALTATLGIAGLAFSLAAQDTLADAISGFIILLDQPFRVGDRIEIQELGTWGDVVEIGSRTTRIRTRDNRMVIVPNSTIGKNQVVNYTFPDPQYRVQTHVGIAYGSDIEAAREVIIHAVRQVPGVLPDHPVEALYVEMGDSAMVFRVRWWIESYADTRRMFDKVHTAIQKVMDSSGIESPFPTQTVNVVQAPPPEKQELAPFLSGSG